MFDMSSDQALSAGGAGSVTFCLLARCARSARLGIAIASDAIGIGWYCDGAVRPNVGIAMTLGAPDPRNNRLALNQLAVGFGPSHVLEQLRANDALHARWRIAIVDREGGTSAYSGAGEEDAGHAIGENCVALAVRGRAVAEALRGSFEKTPALDLDARLLQALECVRESRNGALRSVALVVFGDNDYSDVDLRVDLHADPIAELRRLYDEYQPFAQYYDERGRHPREAITQREFADMLYARKDVTR